jgi:hypothetical protein
VLGAAERCGAVMTRSTLAGIAAATLVFAAAGVVATSADAAVERPPGAGKPVPGSGIGTAAALNGPRCTKESPATGQPLYGGYGRWNSTAVGGGPICVKPWKDGADNGGATSPGVTTDRITVVVVVPNSSQLARGSVAQGTVPVLRSDPTTAAGSYEDAVHDHWLPFMPYYETWGRDIDVRIVTSAGDDEAAQRADAVTIKAMKPFAVIDMVSTGLDVLDGELAKARIVTYGDATTVQKALAQAPYRWGLSDAQSAAINAAEVIGKQLVGKKAVFAGGDQLGGSARKFGIVFIESQVDIDQFRDVFAKFGGKVASVNEYPSSGTSFGDDSLAQEYAPAIVTRMKNAGVTTVIMLSDIAMNRTMMKAATNQEWFPEWYSTGAVFQDLAIFARTYPPEQSAHMFGVSSLSPYVVPEPTPEPPAKSLTVQLDNQEWYWGAGVGTRVANVVPRGILWFLQGVHSAGPDLTPKTFQQGQFSIPATGGAASGYPTGGLVGYGKTPGLPYDEYMTLGLDFSPMWWDAETTGRSNAIGVEGKGVVRYVDGAKRYRASTWPKKPFRWFEEDETVVFFETRQTPTPLYVGDCRECPSGSGVGQAGTPSKDGFVAKAYGEEQFGGG